MFRKYESRENFRTVLRILTIALSASVLMTVNLTSCGTTESSSVTTAESAKNTEDSVNSATESVKHASDSGKNTSDSSKNTSDSGKNTYDSGKNTADSGKNTSDSDKNTSESGGNSSAKLNNPISGGTSSGADSEADSQSGEGFTITMLDVGQGLSLVISADGHHMIYDGGGREASSYVVNYLQRNDMDSLDYVIASHYDEDHIAGLVGCLYSCSVDTVICPDYTADSEIYQSFEKALNISGAETVYPEQGDTFELGGASVTVVGPETYDSDTENNNSVVVRIRYGDFTCLLTGDAEAEEEEQILDSGESLHSDLLVVGHHGSSSSTSNQFYRAVGPSTVWISCGIGNDYGHPAQKTMNLLEKSGVSMYRTDLQGDVTCSSDGDSWSFSAMACEDYSDGSTAAETAYASADRNLPADTSDSGDSGAEDSGEDSSAQEDEKNSGEAAGNDGDSSAAQDYVLNTSSGKFHRPDCSAVEKMSPKNKKETEADRSELIAQGYEPCGICNP